MSRIHGQMSQLILKRASASRPSGQWRDDDLRRGGAALLSPASSSHRPRRRTAPGCGRPVITATSSALPSATSQWRRWRTDPAPALGTKAAPLLIRALRPRRIPAGRRSCRTSRSWGGRTDASAECHWLRTPKNKNPGWAAGVPSPTGWVRGWGTWGHAIQWRLVNSGAARQFLQARKSRERPGETDENGYKAGVLWREVAGNDGSANRPSTVPAPTAR
jgi:hypothetical protein